VTVAASRGCCERLAAEPAAAADERLGESKLRRRNCERRSRLIGVALGLSLLRNRGLVAKDMLRMKKQGEKMGSRLNI
jgi:hypothetical protein